MGGGHSLSGLEKKDERTDPRESLYNQIFGFDRRETGALDFDRIDGPSLACPWAVVRNHRCPAGERDVR